MQKHHRQLDILTLDDSLLVSPSILVLFLFVILVRSSTSSPSTEEGGNYDGQGPPQERELTSFGTAMSCICLGIVLFPLCPHSP